jgi:mannosyltransferase
MCALRYNPKPMGLGYTVSQTVRHTGSHSVRYPGQRTPLPYANLVRIMLLLIVLVAWALRLVVLDRQDIWWDEARNIDVALRPFTQVAIAPELDIHPPVYFWLLHGWARLNALAMGMEPVQIAVVTRLLSVIAGVLSVALLYQLAWRSNTAANRYWGGVVAALIGALSPFWLAESQETRMYTVGFALLLAAAVALLMAWRRLEEAAPSSAALRGPLIGFVLLSALALLTHYNAVFIVAAWYLGWLVCALFHPQRRQLLTLMLVCGVATALLVAPIAPIALRQIPGYANPNLIVPTVAEYLTKNWQAYWGGYAFVPLMGRNWATVWLWVSVAIAGGGVLLAWVASQRKTPLGFLLLWLFVGLALYYMAVLDRGAFNVRYSSFVTPALYATIGVGLTAWSRFGRTIPVVALAGLLAIWPEAIYADLYDDRFAREDISGVTAWLRENAEPGAVIFVDQKYPFGFYYHRYTINPVDSDPANSMPSDSLHTAAPNGPEVAPARYLFVDINTIDQELNRWAADATQVFWVQWFESDTDPRRSVAFLLEQAGEREGEQNFQGYSIDWWRLTPPNEFVLAPNMAPLSVAFPPAVQTVEASFPTEPVMRGGAVPVTIRWQRQPGGEVTRPLKARVALYSQEGARIVQSDERLLNDRHLLPAEWSPEDRPLNVYLLDVPEDLATGQYTIGLLVYDADSMEPLGVVDSAGNPAGVEAAIGVVEVIESEP